MFGGAAVAAALPAVANAATVTPFHAHDLADWQKYVGKDFAIAGENGASKAQLVSVSGEIRQSMRSGSPRGHNFAVRFEMDAAKAPAGGQLYAVRHADLGNTSLYLERVTAPAGKAAFRAYFS